MGREHMGEIVLRGGIAKADLLMQNYRQHKQAPGVYGCSVQYAPGRTWQDLALAGQFKNGQVSIADEDLLRAALAALGYSMRLVPSPGRGFHHTLVVLYDKSGQRLTQLPRDAALALANAFQQRANPYQVP